MDLSELYTTGTKLSDVKPAFQGMPYLEWLQKSTCRMIQTIAAARKDEAFPIALHTRESKKKVAEQRIYTPRDGYGMKGVR